MVVKKQIKNHNITSAASVLSRRSWALFILGKSGTEGWKKHDANTHGKKSAILVEVWQAAWTEVVKQVAAGKQKKEMEGFGRKNDWKELKNDCCFCSEKKKIRTVQV